MQKYKIVKYDVQDYYCDCTCRVWTDAFWAAIYNTMLQQYTRNSEYERDFQLSGRHAVLDGAHSVDRKAVLEAAAKLGIRVLTGE